MESSNYCEHLARECHGADAPTGWKLTGPAFHLPFFPPPKVRLIDGPTVTSPSVGIRSSIPILKCRNSSMPTLGVSAATK